MSQLETGVYRSAQEAKMDAQSQDLCHGGCNIFR